MAKTKGLIAVTKGVKTKRHPIQEREFTVVVQRDEDGYLAAEVLELQGCYTQAKSWDELIERVQEVILLCLEDEEPLPMEFVSIQRLKLVTVP